MRTRTPERQAHCGYEGTPPRLSRRRVIPPAEGNSQQRVHNPDEIGREVSANKKAIHVFRSQMLGTGLMGIIRGAKTNVDSPTSPQGNGHWGHSRRCRPPSQARRRKGPILPVQLLFSIILAIGIIGIFHVHANTDTLFWFQQYLSASAPFSKLEFPQCSDQIFR